MAALSALLVSALFLQDDGDLPVGYPDPVAEVLDRLDAMAEQMAEDLAAREGREVHVVALLHRQHAAQLGADATQAYTLSTYRFRQHNRDDARRSFNNWDLLFQDRQDVLDVRTVADDLSRIWDLGQQPFPRQLPLQPRLCEPDHQVACRAGHLYLVHALDTDHEAWFLVQPLAHQSGEWTILRWQTLEDPAAFGVLRVNQVPQHLMQDGQISLRMVLGATDNPQRVDATGQANSYLHHAFLAPDTGEGVAIRESEGVAFVRGGRIPEGKALVVEGLSITARGRRPATNPARLRGVAGGSLWHDSEGRDEVAEIWKGRFVLHPGQEHRLFLEASSYEFAEMLVDGRLVELAEVKRKKLDQLSGKERRQVDQHLAALGSSAGVEFEDHMDAIARIGPRVRPFLEAIPQEARSGNTGSALEMLLDRLSEGVDRGPDGH